jgi:hypothetical protein
MFRQQETYAQLLTCLRFALDTICGNLESWSLPLYSCQHHFLNRFIMLLAHVLYKSTQHDNFNKSCSIAFLSMSFPFLDRFIMLVRGQQVELYLLMCCARVLNLKADQLPFSLCLFHFLHRFIMLDRSTSQANCYLLCKRALQDSVNKKTRKADQLPFSLCLFPFWIGSSCLSGVNKLS